MSPRQRTTDHARVLVERAQAGDADAFGELFRRHWHEVLQIAMRRVGGDRALAEDIAADTFERAWRGLPRFAWRAGGFGAWLATIAVNRCRDWAKSSRCRMETLAGDHNITAAYQPDTDRRHDPEAVAFANAATAALDAALADLTAPQRQVLALRFGAGLDVAEAAAAMGCTAGAVKATQHRAVKALREQMGVAA